MAERRKYRLSDWFNTGVGVVVIGFMGWAGTKLVEVREDVAEMRGDIKFETKLVKETKEATERNADNIADHETRLVRVETVLDLRD